MTKFNKNKILNFEKSDNTSLQNLIGKEVNHKSRIQKIKKKINLKKIKDINGMEISYAIFKKEK